MDDITRIFHTDETNVAYIDIAETFALFSSSYLPPSINRCYNSYAVGYKRGDAKRYRAVFAPSSKLKKWKAWGEAIAQKLRLAHPEVIFNDDARLASVKVTATMGQNADIDARTKVVQDVFQGYIFSNDNMLDLSGDIKLVTHKRKDQGILYLICHKKDFLKLFSMVILECDGLDLKSRKKIAGNGETIFLLRQKILKGADINADNCNLYS